MRKRNELADPTSCLNKAGDDEWLFVLLSRDITAVGTVQDWIKRRVRLGLNIHGDLKIAEAERWCETVISELNARRIELAEKKSRDDISCDEHAEFLRLQDVYFEYLDSKYPRASVGLERLAAIEECLRTGKP